MFNLRVMTVCVVWVGLPRSVFYFVCCVNVLMCFFQCVVCVIFVFSVACVLCVCLSVLRIVCVFCRLCAVRVVWDFVCCVLYALCVCCVLCIVHSVRPCVLYASVCVLCDVRSARNVCFIHSVFPLVCVFIARHFACGVCCACFACDRGLCACLTGCV